MPGLYSILIRSTYSRGRLDPLKGEVCAAKTAARTATQLRSTPYYCSVILRNECGGSVAVRGGDATSSSNTQLPSCLKLGTFVEIRKAPTTASTLARFFSPPPPQASRPNGKKASV